MKRLTDLEIAIERIRDEAQYALDLEYNNVSDEEQAEMVLGMIDEALLIIRNEVKSALKMRALEKAKLGANITKAVA